MLIASRPCPDDRTNISRNRKLICVIHGSRAAISVEVLEDIFGCVSLDYLQLVNMFALVYAIYMLRLHTVEAYSSCGLTYIL